MFVIWDILKEIETNQKKVNPMDENIEKMIDQLNEWLNSEKLELKNAKEIENLLKKEKELENIQDEICKWKTKDDIKEEIILKRDEIRKELVENYKIFLKWAENLDVEKIQKGYKEKLSNMMNFFKDKKTKEIGETQEKLDILVKNCLDNYTKWKKQLSDHLNERKEKMKQKQKAVSKELITLGKMFDEITDISFRKDDFIGKFRELKYELDEIKNDVKLKEIEQNVPKQQIIETLEFLLKYYYNQFEELNYVIDLKSNIVCKLQEQEEALKFEVKKEIEELENLNDKCHDISYEINKTKLDIQNITIRKRSNYEKQIEGKERQMKELQVNLRKLTKEREKKIVNLTLMTNKYLPEMKLMTCEIDFIQYLESDGLERKRTKGDYESVEEMKIEGNVRHNLLKAKWDGKECVLKEFLLKDENGMKSFRKEIQSLGKLKHPNIVEIECFFIEEGEIFRGYIEMPFYEGGNLKEWIKNKKPSELQIQRILSQILKGIEFIHSKDIIHCDLKPQNILMTKDGNPKITDFEISKEKKILSLTLTQSTLIGGTPDYMSPVRKKIFLFFSVFIYLNQI